MPPAPPKVPSPHQLAARHTGLPDLIISSHLCGIAEVVVQGPLDRINLSESCTYRKIALRRWYVNDWGTLLAAAIAAMVAVLGYAFNQQANRRDRKTRFYAEALRAIKELEEMPYRIAKRKDSSPEIRATLGREVNDIFINVSFYLAWLEIDSPLVGRAYELLARRAIQCGEYQRRHAWGSAVITNDEEVELGEFYSYATKRELSVCTIVMRRELSFFTILLYRSTKAMVDRCAQEYDQRTNLWAAQPQNQAILVLK
jgi:hypothetical protein